MSEILQFTVDKFTFTIPTDRLYHPDGLWVQERAGRLFVGVTDYLQKNSGDVAFAEVAEPGRAVTAGGWLANIETIKINVQLSAPVSGMVAEANDKLEFEAEIINQDPYGAGWLVVLEPSAWAAERAALLSPVAYYVYSYTQALQESGKQ